MSIKFNVPGKERKNLVQAISKWDGSEIKYLGAPTFTYAVGEHLTIDRDGSLENNGMEPTAFERLIQHLVGSGFECDMSIETTETNEESPTYLDISIPAAELSENALANLEALVTAKGKLIRKAVNSEELKILKIGDAIHFPWFSIDSSTEETHVYMLLIEKLIAMAKNAKRVTAKEKETDNDKYAFRCFLLRLGFIGDEYKEARKILLKNLAGNSAFQSGHKKEVEVG